MNHQSCSIKSVNLLSYDGDGPSTKSEEGKKPMEGARWGPKEYNG